MRPCSARVSFMATSNETTFGVGFYIPVQESARRRAELIEEENGYRYIRYSGETSFVDLNEEAESDLLKLIRPYALEQVLNYPTLYPVYPEIDLKDLVKFLNKWGTIASGNSDKVSVLQKGESTKSRFTHALGFYLSTEAEAVKLLGEFSTHYKEIRNGNEVPLPWIEEELRTIAWILRLVIALLEEEPKIRKSEYDFESYSFRIRKAVKKKILLTHEHYVHESEDKVQELLDLFAHNLNRLIQPLTFGIFYTENTRNFYERRCGFETAFATQILATIREARPSLLCVVCGSSFFARRVQENRFYCGQTCSRRKRQKDQRDRERAKKARELKVSTSKPKRKVKPKTSKKG